MQVLFRVKSNSFCPRTWCKIIFVVWGNEVIDERLRIRHVGKLIRCTRTSMWSVRSQSWTNSWGLHEMRERISVYIVLCENISGSGWSHCFWFDLAKFFPSSHALNSCMW